MEGKVGLSRGVTRVMGKEVKVECGGGGEKKVRNSDARSGRQQTMKGREEGRIGFE